MSEHSGDLGGLGGGHEASSLRDRPEGQEGSFTLLLPAFYFEPYSVWNTDWPSHNFGIKISFCHTILVLIF